MDKAKAAVSNFLSKDGKHDTTVHETINPAVQNEHVTPTRHENITKAVDREVHQDHHHTSVQPITDREVLPEQHSHQMAGVEHRQFHHGNDDHVKQRLAAEQAQFKDSRTVHDTQHTQSANPTIAGEHIHHHVHENIQPVIHKETIQPSVVHSTIPVHEVHHNEAKHHTASQLPAVSMSEFQTKGGSLTGREERTDAFAGEPRSVGGALGGANTTGTHSSTTGTTTGTTSTTGHHHGAGHHHNNKEGLTNTTGSSTTTGQGKGYTNDGLSNATSGNNTTTTGQSQGYGNDGLSNTHSGSTTTGKPSLMDKLNPMKDSNGDGKAGFMK